MVFGGNRASCHRNVDAIEERNRAQNKQPEDKIPANVARTRFRHRSTGRRNLLASTSCGVCLEQLVEPVGDNVLLAGLEHEGTHRETGILAAMFLGSRENDGGLRASQSGIGFPRRKIDARGVPLDFHVWHMVRDVWNEI